MPDTPKPVTPTAVLPDGVDGGDFQGTYVRKGSIAAFIANVKALDALTKGSPEYGAIADQIRELKPSLEAVGLFDVVTVRDPDVAAILGR